MLPEPLRDWLADGAQRMSVPPDYSAAAAIVALAAVIGRKVCVRPKRHDDWTICPNLWGAVVGPPSVLRSACIEESLRHLRRIEPEAWTAHAQAGRAYRQGQGGIGQAEVEESRR